MPKQPLLLGAHMSIAGGFEQALFRGESIGCTAIQIFTKSNRQWRANPITQEQATLFKETAEKSSIQWIMTHASYLINIAAPDPEIHKKSIAALAQELQRCELLGIPYLILHPGSAGKGDQKAALAQIAQSLDDVFNEIPGSTMILLENMAGQGSSTCSTFESLAAVRQLAHHKKRLGFCFDTCHAFAAGYDLRTEASYEKTWKEFDEIIGIEHLKAMHINDSKKELGSKVDRHEEIGHGALGLESFRLLFNDPRFFSIPKILETPKDTLEDYAKNMLLLRRLISRKTAMILDLDGDKQE